ncbi:MAG: response regulator transcription factor [Chloroflexota bacterium]|nr:response regulator transcription factor [Ardenticatenaceae bacterium]
MQVILVASNLEERDMLTYILKYAGMAVASSSSLQRVAAKWLERPADLVVVAGATVNELLAELVQLRQITQVPCLLIIESPSEEELCQLLRNGADLVLPRPVSPRILAEYTKTMLRRNRTVPTSVLPRLNVTEIKLDPDTRTIRVLDGDERRLTQLEFRLLYILMVNRGQVVPVDTIVERVWGYTGQGSRELVRGLISRLRRKIEPDISAPQFIQNVPGVGYRFSLENL